MAKNNEKKQIKYSKPEDLGIGAALTIGKPPKTTVTFANYNGELILDNLEIEIKTLAHYNCMRNYFWSHLFPRILPERKEKKTKKKRAASYTG